MLVVHFQEKTIQGKFETRFANIEASVRTEGPHIWLWNENLLLTDNIIRWQDFHIKSIIVRRRHEND